MAELTAQTFIDALQRLEAQADLDGMVALHDEEVELHNPLLAGPQHGTEGARRFWDLYRRSFAEVRSQFRHVAQADGVLLLEWTSTGRLPDGTPFEYAGVSVVEHQGGRIRRFCAYFDPSTLQARSAPPQS